MAMLMDLQGYTLVLDKVVFITRVFDASEGQGSQFNVRLVGGDRLAFKFADRNEATLQRELLVKALRES